MIETTANGHNSAKAMLPPHNLEAESSVLGAVLLDERHLNGIVLDERLRGEDFYRSSTARCSPRCCTLHEDDRQIDHLTVAEVMRGRGQLEAIGGPDAVEQLAGWVPAAGARPPVRPDRSRERAAAPAAGGHLRDPGEVAERGDSVAEMIDAAEQQIFKLRGEALRASRRLLEDAVDEEIDRLQQAALRRT